MIESNVTSIEISKKLYNLGFKTKTIFVWEWFSDECYALKYVPFAVFPGILEKVILYPAYTASEIYGSEDRRK